MEFYDSKTDNWTSGPKMMETVRNHSSCVLKDTLYIFAGYHTTNYRFCKKLQFLNVKAVICDKSNEATWSSV